MDNIDKQIMDLLAKDSRMHNQEIANKLNVTEGTIRHRIRRLVEEGIIEGFTIKCKSTATSLILIKLDPGTRTAEFVKTLKKIDNISNIYHVTGEDSIICHVDTENTDHLDSIVETIRTHPGVLSTKTISVLKRY